MCSAFSSYIDSIYFYCVCFICSYWEVLYSTVFRQHLLSQPAQWEMLDRTIFALDMIMTRES